MPNDHEHQNITNYGIKDKEVARRIQELYKLGVSKPKKILELLDNEVYQVPTKIKIINFIKKLKIKKFGKPNMHLGIY